MSSPKMRGKCDTLSIFTLQVSYPEQSHTYYSVYLQTPTFSQTNVSLNLKRLRKSDQNI